MKFQIPNIHHSKVNRRTHAHTHRQTDKPKAICPSNFFKVGGIKNTDYTIIFISICMKKNWYHFQNPKLEKNS